MQTILVIDDDEFIQIALTKTLEEEFIVRCASDLATARKRISDSNPVLIYLDINVEKLGDGVEFLKEIKMGSDVPPVIMMSTDHSYSQECWREGSIAFWIKPFDVFDILDDTKIALKHEAESKARWATYVTTHQYATDLYGSSATALSSIAKMLTVVSSKAGIGNAQVVGTINESIKRITLLSSKLMAAHKAIIGGLAVAGLFGYLYYQETEKSAHLQAQVDSITQQLAAASDGGMLTKKPVGSYNINEMDRFLERLEE